MNKKNKGFLFALLLLLGAYPLKAQEACIDFEDFQLGTFFGPELGNMPGDTLFEQSGAVVTAQTLQYANGQIGFLNAFIEGPPDAPWLDGNYLFISNNTLLLHFPPGTQQVCFDFFDLGGDDNFAVNGAAVSVLDQFTEVEELSFPGVTIELSLDTIPGINLLIGTVCLSGDIESLLIGGQEFGIDNICFSGESDDDGDDACLGFEGLDPPSYGSGAGTPPGQVFYSEGDVNLRLAPFQGIFWTTTYGNLQVRQAGDTPGFTAAGGQHLKFEGINTIFDLTGYPEPADSVVVDFYYTGGAVNLAANGAPFLIQSLLTPGFYALAPGVTLEVNFNSANSTEGQLVFAGNLQSLLIGGETGLYLDNFCVNPQPNCELGELIVEAGPCNPNGVFTVNLALDNYTGTADSFALWINGNDTGQRRAYTDMPVVLFPFVAPTPALTFTIVDLNDPNCQATAVLPPNNCDPACPLESVDILAGPICGNTGQYTLRLRVDGPTVGDVLTIRSLITNASSEVALGLNNILSVTLPGPANGADSLSICLPGTSANVPCCLTLAVDVDCPPLPCTVIDSVIYHLTDCGPNGTADLVIDQVLYTPTFVLPFSVFVNGQFFGPYSTAMLPISVGPFSPDDGPLEVLVTENQTNACGYVFTAGPVDCGGNCPLESGQILPNSISCYDNYTYNASILLPGVVPGTSLIVESGATGYRDTLLYSNTSVTLGLRLEGWPTPPNGIETLSICAISPSDCCITISFDVDCPPVGCNLEAQIETINCAPGADNYTILFSLTGLQTGDVVSVSSEQSGFTQTAVYDGQLLELEFPIPNTGFNYDLLEVCTDNSSDCCMTLEFDLPCMICNLENVVLALLPCDGDSLYSFVLDFEPIGQTADFFTVATSNGAQDTFAYADLPVTVGPVLGYGEVIDLWIQDLNGNCGYYEQLISPDCEDGCVLGDVSIVGNAGCNDDGTYNVPLSIENTVAGDELIVTSMATGYEEVMQVGVLNTNFLQLSDWPVPPSGVDSLSICFADQPECCTSISFNVGCPPGCTLQTEVSLLSCEPNGLMTFEVTTTTTTTNATGFALISVGDVNYGLVAVDTTVEVGLVINDGYDSIAVTVAYWPSQFSGPLCTVVETVDVSGCASACEIPGLSVQPLGCSDFGAGSYEVEIAFNPDSLLANQTFDIYANGELRFQNITVQTLSPFVPLDVFPYNPGTSPDVITVCYHDEPDCCQSFAVEPLDCYCTDITAMVPSMLACEEDGTYFVMLDLVFSNNESFPFGLWVDGVEYEIYSPEDVPLIVGPFAGDGQPHTFYAQGDGQCLGAEAEVPGQFCDSNCPLESVQLLDVPTCAGANGTFYHALFELSGVNAPGDSVIVTSAITGASTLGVLDPNDGNTFDINLPNTNLGFDEVTICLFNQPDCCFSLDYDIDCPINPDCEIEGLVLEPRGCQDDGTFELFVDLEYQGPPSSIRVSIPELGWSQVYGANAFPIEIPGLIGDGQTYQVNISATDCDLELEALVEFPNCNGECTFGNVIAEPQDCENGQFMVDIEVQASNSGSLGFLAFVNGSIFGPFSYEPAFVTVGPFTGDGTTVYNILLLDFENPSCFAYLEIGPVDCSNCQIRNLSATPQPCHEDGSYDLVIDFEVDNPTDTVFTVEFGDAVVAFPLTDLPLTLAHYGLGEGSIDTLKVCIGYDNSCCERVAFEQPACLDEGCVTFEPFAGFFSTPNSGGDSWQPIGSESGVRLSYAIADLCMCEVQVTDVTAFPFFGPGEGAVLQLRQAALRTVMPGTAEQVSFDCAIFNDGLLLSMPNADPILLDTLSEGIAIPLPDGNTIEKRLYPASSPNSTPVAEIILRGQIDSLQLFGYGLIDNLCYELAEEEVWPGDANADNIANHFDLLSLGLAYGSSGPARVSLSSDWTELSAQNWGLAFADGTDYKHADCNGDGVIDLEDRAVILQNYGQTNGTPGPWPNLPGTDFDPPVYVPFPGTLPDNFNFQVPIIVGESDNALQDVYGIAFTVRFDPEVIDPASIAVVYPTSWFGEPGVNTLTLHQVHEDGRIEMSITRIDRNNVSGHGQVAYIIGIIDDIAGIIKESEVEVEAVLCMDVDENWIPLQGRSTTFELQPDKDELPADEVKGLFTVHPNPASDWVTVSSRHSFMPDRLRLFNLSGQELQVPTEAQRVSLAGLPSGVYLLQITTGKTSVYRRVVKH